MTAEPTLRQLISELRGKRSYEELARDCGGAPGAKRLQQLATKDLRNFPDPDSIDALSLGLRTSVTQVVLASARSLGLRVNTAEDESTLVIGKAGELPEGAREALVAVAQQMLALRDVALLDPGVPATREDQVPGATSQPDAGWVVDPEHPENAHLDLEPEATAAAQAEYEEQAYRRYLGGEGGWDQVTTQRFKARRAAEEAELPAAARTVERSPGRESAEESRRRGEESQDPGGTDGDA